MLSPLLAVERPLRVLPSALRPRVTSTEAVALSGGTSGVSTVCTIVGNVLAKRIAKHQQIETAAATHRDAVLALLSKAMAGQTITHKEYSLVLKQATQYRQQKAEFRSAARVEKLDSSKKELQSQVRAELITLLGGNSGSR